MKDTLYEGPPTGGLDMQTVAALVTDLAFVAASEERVRAVTGAHYRAHVPRLEHASERAAIEISLAAAKQRLQGHLTSINEVAPLITVMSSEEVCPPNRLRQITGQALAFLGVGMLTAIPLLVATALYQSGMLELVLDWPVIGLLYGLGPLGAAVAIHALRECLEGRRLVRVFDGLVYGGAVISVGYWATLIGPTFLADSAAGFGAAVETSRALSDWYGAQLIVELLGGAACLNAAGDLLTQGAKPVSVPNPARTALQETVSDHEAALAALAAKADALSVHDGAYDAAVAAFEDRCVLHVEAATKLLAAQAGADAQTALASVRATIFNTLTTKGTPHA
ncbi:MAG: hypothetical protein AAFR17_16985 [Pseudomonadota bacterium]